jgi:hypothetical protein
MLVCYVSRVSKLLDEAISRSKVAVITLGFAGHNPASEGTEKETWKEQVTEDEGGRDGVGGRIGRGGEQVNEKRIIVKNTDEGKNEKGDVEEK